MLFHLYADDMQLYMTFDNDNLISKASARIQMEQCIEEIWSWMNHNKFKLNGNKAEFLHFCPEIKHSYSNLITAIKIGSDIISSGRKARNLGVIFESDFTLNTHITSICKSADYWLYRISYIKKY